MWKNVGKNDVERLDTGPGRSNNTDVHPGQRLGDGG